MTTKISRRTQKLGITNGPLWLCSVLSVIQEVRRELDQRWSTVEHDPDPRGTANDWNPTTLNPANDCQLALSSSELPSLHAVASGLDEVETGVFLAESAVSSTVGSFDAQSHAHSGSIEREPVLNSTAIVWRPEGVVLVQPEHLLSFELMGLEQLLSGDADLGMHMVETQFWLENHSRDILDESDEILNVNFELIYTMGTQRPVDMSPDCWTIIQYLLGLLARFAKPVLEEYPGGLEVKDVNLGSTPCIRILQPQAGRALLLKVAAEVCTSGLPGVPLHFFSPDVRDAILRFLTDRDIAEADMKLLRQRAWAELATRRSLLLLRGLISGGVLTFALERKRWRVNYGHDLSRTMLAVPYRAKDTPAPRAEFSHPDATIVLTCLAYYASGLSDEQLRTAFERLFLCDHAQEEYELWVRGTTDLPPALRRLTGVNLKDSTQCSEQLFPSLRSSKATIDFYMSQVVFPAQMREFPQKMSASGWNIARSKVHLTTGLSGTNDSRYILPLDAQQCELPEQMHTNAQQLGLVLRPENSFQHMPRQGKGSLDADSLLRMVVASRPPVRVIIDVGAQVLELRNEQVAGAWLALLPEPEAQAVIFFSEQDELCVLSRLGTVEFLRMSPFAQKMDQCLVYLDEAHTRGTDLRLPADYRAAVTLGPGLTKDRLVQETACMRMRKLGKGQSLFFCAPADVEERILKCCGKALGETIDVADVLHHSVAWSELAHSENKQDLRTIAQSFFESEALSIEERYGLGRPSPQEQLLLQGDEDTEDSSLAGRKRQLDIIRNRCREFSLVTLREATLQEMKERELSPENEREEQVENPPALEPRKHSVHPDVTRFIEEGILDRSSIAFQPAFASLSSTSAFTDFETNSWPEYLLVTADFAHTVQASKNQVLDHYIRPVQWIASCAEGDQANYVILSPHEVNELLPCIR
ncbi:hypothetical protein VTN77DRAFT_7424 [Rasamsonia byssochlamydoides]|uniref:uncharacterized protein n=1 Tax=Rasamsonia byssochlamydoides TaxID=89139 RepID=UPI00374420E5